MASVQNLDKLLAPMPSPTDLTSIRKVDIFSHRSPADLEAAIHCTLMIAGCADGAYFVSCAPGATVSTEVLAALRAHNVGASTYPTSPNTLRDTNIPLSPLAPYAPTKPTNLFDLLDAEDKSPALKTPARRTANVTVLGTDEKSEGAEDTEFDDASLTQPAPIPQSPTPQQHHFLSSDAALVRIMLANMRAFHGSFPRSTQAINRALSPGSKGPAPLSLLAQVDPAHRIPAYNTAMLSWRAVKIIQHIVQTEAPLGGSIAAPLLK